MDKLEFTARFKVKRTFGSRVHKPGGQVHQAAGQEQQPCTEKGILAGDLDCKLEERTCPNRSDVLLIPRLPL